MRPVRRHLPALVIQSFYTTCIRPTLEYASVAWCGMGASDAERLERVQRAAARLIANVSVADHLPCDLLLARAGLECLQSFRRMHCAVFAFHLSSTSRRLVPSHLAHLFEQWKARTPASTSSLTLLSTSTCSSRLPRPRTELFGRSPFYHSLSVLNSVSSQHHSSLAAFKSFLLASDMS